MSSSPAARVYVPPFASHRDMYLLAVGLVLGVLLGPAVLGRWAPGVYDAVFVGGGDAAAELAAAEASLADDLDRLTASGVSDVALRERESAAQRNLLPLRLDVATRRAGRQATLDGWMLALIVATLIVMAIESLVSPRPSGEARATAIAPVAVGRLITVRYALLALWVGLALARPQTLANLPVLFTLLLVIVALAAAFVPLGPAKPPAPAADDDHGWE